MLKTFRFGLLSATMLAFTTGAALADYELNILHINDFHSRIESINKTDSTCSAEDEAKSACFGGAARLLTAINETRDALKAGDKNVLLLNAGDNFQGSLFYTTYKGSVEAEVLNAMKFDAMTVGNHEFDDSEDGLAGFLDKVQFPVVTANVLASASSKLGDRIKPSIVLEVGAQKIGVVGAVTNDTEELATPGPNVLIAEDVATITAEVVKLKADGVDKIIALTHVGYPRDLSAIAKIPDVDVVVGGHSHTLLSNTVEGAEGPYPTLVDNPGGYKVPVVQAGQYSKYLGDLKVVFDDAGVVKEATGEPILIDSKFKPDEAIVKRIDELKAPIEELKTKVVGASDGLIQGDRKVCRVKECEMGNLVADAQLDRVKDQGVTVSLANGGGLRASIDAGEITMGEVLTVLPFQNTIATFQIKGADLVAALENGASQIDDGAGRFLQVSGLKYTFDRSKPVGSRISAVEVKEGDAFVAIDPAKAYGVVTNNYVRGGGDGFDIFASKAEKAYDFGPNLEQAVAGFLTANNPYKPYLDGRITDATPATYVPAAKVEAAAPAAPAAAAPVAPAPAAPTADTAVTTPAAPAPSIAPSGTASGPTRYTVERGDSLWKIAARTYGEGTMWTKVAETNALKNPDLIAIGEEIELPAK